MIHEACSSPINWHLGNSRATIIPWKLRRRHWREIYSWLLPGAGEPSAPRLKTFCAPLDTAIELSNQSGQSHLAVSSHPCLCPFLRVPVCPRPAPQVSPQCTMSCGSCNGFTIWSVIHFFSAVPHYTTRLGSPLIHTDALDKVITSADRDTTVHYEVVSDHPRSSCGGPGQRWGHAVCAQRQICRPVVSDRKIWRQRRRWQQLWRHGEIWPTNDSIDCAAANYLERQIDAGGPSAVDKSPARSRKRRRPAAMR